MKKTLLVALALTGFVSGSAIAQETVKKGTDKEIKMEVVNGVKTLTIKSTGGAYPTEEIYTGEAAEKKLAEIEAEDKGKKSVEMKMIKIDDKKQLTVITTENGVVTEEVFEGEAADAKMKELEGNEAPKKKKIVIEEKKVIEKSVD